MCLPGFRRLALRRGIPDMTNPSQSASHLLGVLRAERTRGFDGLAGSRIEATLPLRQAALDAALSQVRGWPAAVDGLAVEIGDANRLLVIANVKVLGFRTPVRLHLRLVPSMQDGMVRLVIDDGSLMASAVALLGPLLGNLPEGLVLQGRQLTVDVRRIAAQQGLDDLAGMVSRATFDSSHGVLWITIHAEAPAPEPSEPQVTRSSSAGNPLPFGVAELRAWLQGARVGVDVRMDERLANDLLAALHADAQMASGDERRDIVTRAVQQPVVRFEPGVLRLAAEAALDPDGPLDS